MHSATETSAAELINRSTDYGQQTTVFVHDINDVTTSDVVFLYPRKVTKYSRKNVSLDS